VLRLLLPPVVPAAGSLSTCKECSHISASGGLQLANMLRQQHNSSSVTEACRLFSVPLIAANSAMHSNTNIYVTLLITASETAIIAQVYKERRPTHHTSNESTAPVPSITKFAFCCARPSPSQQCVCCADNAFNQGQLPAKTR
jgi:hypothetical protein